LFALEVGFIAVFTGGIRPDFSFSSYFSFFGSSEICAQPFSFRNRINRDAILKNVSCVTADLMDRRATPSWQW